MVGAMQRSTAALLRSHFRGHNLSVLAASGVALLFSTAGWAVLYGASYWMTLFTRSIGRAAGPVLPASFDTVFLSCAGVLLLLAVLDCWFFPQDFVPDERPALETLADIVLFLPRMTLSVFWNFIVLVRLRSADCSGAVAILERMRSEGKIAMHEIPVAIPDPQSRNRILRAFEFTELTQTRREQGVVWLRFSPLAPKALRHRLLTNNADDDLAGMRRATVLEHKDALPSPKRELPGRNRNDL
jgi:hypothetical protein